MKTDPIQWWECILIVFSIFIICMLFSLLMRKFNEVKLDNRLKELDKKRSWNHGETTRVHRNPINPSTDNATTNQSEVMGAMFSFPLHRAEPMAIESRREVSAIASQLTRACCTVPVENKDSNPIISPKPYLGVLYKGSNAGVSQSLRFNTKESDDNKVQKEPFTVINKETIVATLMSEHLNLNKNYTAEPTTSEAIANGVVEKVLLNMADTIQVPESKTVILHEAQTDSQTTHKDHNVLREDEERPIEPTMQEWLADMILANVFKSKTKKSSRLYV